MELALLKFFGNSPLRQAIFELRFVPTIATAGDLLPGILYSALKNDYSEVLPLPMASVPRTIRNLNPVLKYQTSHRLSSGPHSVDIGDCSVLLQTTEYPGWDNFKHRIESLIDALNQTGFVKQIERFSFKYTNLIEASKSEKQLALLNMQIELTGKAPNEIGFLLRSEHTEEKFTTILQIAPNTSVKIPPANIEISGLMIDVDTIRNVGNELWTNHASILDEGHLVAKQNFISLLTESTIQRLKPNGGT